MTAVSAPIFDTTATGPAAPLGPLGRTLGVLAASLRRPWVASVIKLGAVEDTLAALHPMLSLSQVRARVLRIVDETPSTKTFILQPNALWQGGRAGQFVQVQIEIDGRLCQRAYSLGACPSRQSLAITVRRHDAGLVSQHLHRHVRAGSVITIGQAAGEFVLPPVLPQNMLFFSAGSGITPLMAMLLELQARRYEGDVLFVHICRTAQDFIFGEQLRSLAASFPALRLHVHCTDTDGRWQASALLPLLPQLAQCSAWMCGPSALMEQLSRFWQQHQLAGPLYSEHFVAAPIMPARAAGTAVAVACSRSAIQFATSGADALLLQAERAGLAPKHGCRIGICRSCQCQLASGTVENLQTGELSSGPQLIRLCISAARSDLQLDI